MARAEGTLDRGQLVRVVLLGWLASLGVDFALHAGVFAGIFFRDTPFLLPPEQLFVRIPLGYLAFLLLSAVFGWLMARLSVGGWRAGARFGLVVGGALSVAFTLALASVSTAPPEYLVATAVTQAVLLTAIGAVIGHGLVGDLRPLAIRVGVLDVILVAATVAAQSMGLVPTPPM